MPTVYEIEGLDNMAEIQAELKKITGASSVPRVFIGQKFFGGGDDTVAASRNGTLESLCKAAGF